MRVNSHLSSSYYSRGGECARHVKVISRLLWRSVRLTLFSYQRLKRTTKFPTKSMSKTLFSTMILGQYKRPICIEHMLRWSNSLFSHRSEMCRVRLGRGGGRGRDEIVVRCVGEVWGGGVDNGRRHQDDKQRGVFLYVCIGSMLCMHRL